MSSDDDKDYEVGYGKPPKANQFQKGQSGNPAGRPRQTRSIRTIINEIASEMLEVAMNGKRRKIPKREALIRAVFNNALQGHPKMVQMVLDLLDKYDPVEHRQYVIEGPSPMSLEEWVAWNTPNRGDPVVNPTLDSIRKSDPEKPADDS